MREEQTNDLHFVSDSFISFGCLFLLLPARVYVCESAVVSDKALILMTSELWKATPQYPKIIVQLKPTKEQMRRKKHSCVMSNW